MREIAECIFIVSISLAVLVLALGISADEIVKIIREIKRKYR